MCYLGVGTTPLKRGVKPPQSAFSRLFRSPSGSDEKHRQRPSGFDGQDCRDSERVFEDTADGIVALSSISIAAAKEMELSFKWSAAAGSTATPVHQCKPAAGADTMAEVVNGVFEDTADGLGIVVWSSTSKKRWKSLKHSWTFYAQQPRRIQNCKRQETLV
jgi:hypothetical protein